MKTWSLLLLLPIWQQIGPLTHLKPLDVSAEKFRDYRAPFYPAGNVSLHDLFRENLCYPELAREQGIEGDVWVQFWVLPNGQLAEATVIHPGPGYGLEAEALRLVGLIKKWEPALERGKPIRSRVNLLVRFSLY